MSPGSRKSGPGLPPFSGGNQGRRTCGATTEVAPLAVDDRGLRGPLHRRGGECDGREADHRKADQEQLDHLHGCEERVAAAKRLQERPAAARRPGAAGCGGAGGTRRIRAGDLSVRVTTWRRSMSDTDEAATSSPARPGSCPRAATRTQRTRTPTTRSSGRRDRRATSTGAGSGVPNAWGATVRTRMAPNVDLIIEAICANSAQRRSAARSRSQAAPRQRSRSISRCAGRPPRSS